MNYETWLWQEVSREVPYSFGEHYSYGERERERLASRLANANAEPTERLYESGG